MAGCRGFSGPCPSAPLDELGPAYGARLTMCTSGPAIRDAPQGVPPTSEARRRSSSMTPSGPSTTRSARSTSAVLLLRAGADEEPDHAPAAQVRDRVEGLDVAEVVPDEHHRVGVQLLLQGAHGVALVHPAARTSTTIRPGSRTRPCAAAARSSTGVSRSLRACRVGEPAGVHGDREPLALEVGVARGPRGAAARGARTISVARPSRRPGREHLPVAGRPALVAVLPEHEEVLAGVGDRRRRSRRGRPSATACRTGRPVTTAIAANVLGQGDAGPRRRPGGCAPARGRRRSGRGCRRSRGRPRARAADATRSSYRRRARSLRNSMRPSQPDAGRRPPRTRVRRSRR